MGVTNMGRASISTDAANLDGLNMMMARGGGVVNAVHDSSSSTRSCTEMEEARTNLQNNFHTATEMSGSGNMMVGSEREKKGGAGGEE